MITRRVLLVTDIGRGCEIILVAVSASKPAHVNTLPPLLPIVRCDCSAASYAIAVTSEAEEARL